jgi:hypothetical protein
VLQNESTHRLFREQVDELHVSTADDSVVGKLIGEQQEHSQRISAAKSELIHRIGELLEGVVTSAAV